MQEFDFFRPGSVGELIKILDETGGRVVAGGTDVVPRMRRDLFSTPALVDASHIAELHFIEAVDDQLAIGAMTTHQEIADSGLIQSVNPALAAAAASVGCSQTRHRGTLGGNIANASPAADTVPPLLAFDARVRLLRKGGERSISLREFLVGPGKTKLEPGEFIHSVTFTRLPGRWGAAYQKTGKRNGMAIAVVSVAAAVVLDTSGMVLDARVALGSVAPTVARSPRAEQMLIGREAGPGVVKDAADAVVADISPISDVRSTAEYRLHAARILTRRTLLQAIQGAQARTA
ncbi:MAG: FAD binding domain-containing protein [Chloroflexota bacterium]